MRKALKALWAALIAPPDHSQWEEEVRSFAPRQEQPKHEAWCSLCGWSGTNVEFQAHLQNQHRNDKS